MSQFNSLAFQLELVGSGLGKLERKHKQFYFDIVNNNILQTYNNGTIYESLDLCKRILQFKDDSDDFFRKYKGLVMALGDAGLIRQFNYDFPEEA